jgi:hypothetical protein
MDFFFSILYRLEKDYHPDLFARILILFEKYDILSNIFTEDDYISLLGLLSPSFTIQALQESELGFSGHGRNMIRIFIERQEKLKEILQSKIDFFHDVQILDFSNKFLMTDEMAEKVCLEEESIHFFFLSDFMEECLDLKDSFTSINISFNSLGFDGILQFLKFVQKQNFFDQKLCSLDIRNDRGERNPQIEEELKQLVKEFEQNSNVLVFL